MSLTVDRPFQIGTGDRGRRTVGRRDAAPAPEAPPGRVPRITRLMALAIRFDAYLRDGVVRDHAELARLGHVTRARITQIMNLNQLCPSIQEAILNMPQTVNGRDPIRERHVRPIVAEADWEAQRRLWRQIIGE